jgi:hypothetical protein
MSSKFGDLADEQVVGGADDGGGGVEDGDACCKSDTPSEQIRHQSITPTIVRQGEDPNQLVEARQQQRSSQDQIMVEQPKTLRSSLLFRVSSENSDESPPPTTHRQRRHLSIRNFRLTTLANERIISGDDATGTG